MASKFPFWGLGKKLSPRSAAQKPETESSGPHVPSDIAELASSKASSKGQVIGSATRPFKSVSAQTRKGYVEFNPAKANQDRYIRLVDFSGRPDLALFGVFDGHGSVGHDVSEYISTTLPLKLLELETSTEDNGSIPDRLTSAFAKTARSLAAKKTINSIFSGTTAVVCMLTQDAIYTANAGDSRAVLGRTADGKATPSVVAFGLSDDHKPDRPDEKQRILSKNGRVQACKGQYGEPLGPSRVWLPNQDIPGLAMTRSFGDTCAASVGVVPIPEITSTPRTASDKFIIIASDGVWEFITSQEAVELINNCSTPAEACNVLVVESAKRWKAEEDVIDDITVVVAFL